MADLRRRVAGYSNPALGVAFENLADAFGPPAATDVYAYARAGATRQDAQRKAELWNMRDNPDQALRDRAAIAAGLYNPNQGYYAVDTEAATKRRGQDVESGDRRYGVDVGAATSRANNADTNRTHITTTLLTPIQKDAVRNIPQSVADLYGLPTQQRGVIAAQPGERNVLPGGEVIEGNKKPVTEAEAKGKIITDELTPEERRALGLSEIKDRPVYGTPGGTAQIDPVTKQLRNTQSGEVVAPGTKATNLGAPQTTVNVGPGGEPFGNPPANMAWARNPDGTVRLDERGAPVALPIGGTPLATKQADAERKQGEAVKSRATVGGIVTQDIDRAISAIQASPNLTTGVGAQVTGGVGGTPARNVKGLLDSVRANVGFDRLQQMRNESPTGGALGQVSNKEMELLQSVLGSLDQTQDDTQLVENLKRIKDVTLDIVHGAGNGPARSAEPTATDKATGKRAVFRGGAWVPLD